MIRKLLAIALFAFGCSATLAADDETGAGEKKPGKFGGQLDRGKVFAKMDANGDGKVTKDEFKNFQEVVADKLKQAGKGGKLGSQGGDFAAKMFDRLDANKDGVLTKEEFEKGAGVGGKGGFKKNKKR